MARHPSSKLLLGIWDLNETDCKADLRLRLMDCSMSRKQAAQGRKECGVLRRPHPLESRRYGLKFPHCMSVGQLTFYLCIYLCIYRVRLGVATYETFSGKLNSNT